MRVAASAKPETSTRVARVSVDVPACRLAFGEHLRLVGSCAELGSWDAKAAPMLDWQEGDNWAANLDLPAGSHEFKLVVMRGDGSQAWEQGPNRVVTVTEGPAQRATCRFGSTSEMSIAEVAPAPAEEVKKTNYTPAATSTAASKAHTAASGNASTLSDKASAPNGVSTTPPTPNGVRSSATSTFTAEPVNGAASTNPPTPPAKAEPPNGSAPATKAADSVRTRSPAASRWQALAEEEPVRRDAQELAQAWRDSRAQAGYRPTAAPAPPASKAPPRPSFRPPAATAASPSSSEPSPAQLLLPLGAGIAILGFTALQTLPGASNVDFTAAGGDASGAVATLQRSGGQLLSAFQASSAEVLSNLKANTASLQDAAATAAKKATPGSS